MSREEREAEKRTDTVISSLERLSLKRKIEGDEKVDLIDGNNQEDRRKKEKRMKSEDLQEKVIQGKEKMGLTRKTRQEDGKEKKKKKKNWPKGV